MVMLRTASGQLCQIANSRRCSFGYDQRIEAFGSQGMVRADNHTATSVTVAGTNGFNTEPALPFFLERYADAYRLELDDFVNALNDQARGVGNGRRRPARAAAGGRRAALADERRAGRARAA